jgi:hypothetical protein
VQSPSDTDDHALTSQFTTGFGRTSHGRAERPLRLHGAPLERGCARSQQRIFVERLLRLRSRLTCPGLRPLIERCDRAPSLLDRDLAIDQRIPSVLLSTSDARTTHVTVYLSDAEIHAEVENAVECLLATAGLRIEDRDDPVVGSWFRRMVAGAQEVTRSPAGREAALVTAHAIESRLVLAQDAEVTAKLLQNLAPVLGALQPTKDAVIRAGALLIVKVDWIVSVFQLTAAQQMRLDHRPQLASSPHEIVAALNLVPEDAADITGPPPQRIDPP